VSKDDEKNSDRFIDAAYQNISEDRQKLLELFADVSRVAKASDDVLGLAAVGENLVKIADSLTKQTSQLVELAKLKQRSEIASKSKDEGFQPGEIDHIFDELESRRDN